MNIIIFTITYSIRI